MQVVDADLLPGEQKLVSIEPNILDMCVDGENPST
jgi:hypothetical protein